MTTTTPLLDVAGVHAGYGASEVLFGVDLTVARGEIVGVLGRNGMGKTTLVRTVMGLVRPSAGTIAFAGRAIGGLAPNRVARSGLALVPEGRQVFPNLSVDEHLGAFHRPGVDGASAWTPATSRSGVVVVMPLRRRGTRRSPRRRCAPRPVCRWR